MNEAIGWSAVPNWLIRDSDLNNYELLVYIALLNRANREGECWPGLATLQRDARASRNTVIKTIKALEDRGLVSVSRRRRADGSSESNLYRVHAFVGGSSREPGGFTTETPLVHDVDGGSAPSEPEVLPIEVLPNEEDTYNAREARGVVDAAFETAYEAWPKKVNKKTAKRRFEKAARTRGLDELVDDVVRFGDAYAATTDRQYTPALDAWINGERWTDELPRGPAPRTAVQRNLDEYQRLYGGGEHAGAGSVRALDAGVGSG